MLSITKDKYYTVLCITMQTKQIQKTRTYPQDAVLCLENHQGQRGYECSVEGCRDVWFYGEEVRNFEHVGTVCTTHGYLIPRMSSDELKDKEICYEGYEYWTWHDNRYEIDMLPTIVYTSKGERKEFISEAGQKRRDDLDEFLKSRMK